MSGFDSEQHLERAEAEFSKEKHQQPGLGVKDLCAKIAQLAMENDFLSVVLGRIGDSSAKR